MPESRGTLITVALIGAAGAIAAAVVGAVLTTGGSDGNQRNNTQTGQVGPGNADVFLSRDSGPGGSTVSVSGTGFGESERVVIMFHTEEVGSTTASSEGSFSNVAVTIPTSFSKFAPQQFSIVATGDSSLRAARAPFTITG